MTEYLRAGCSESFLRTERWARLGICTTEGGRPVMMEAWTRGFAQLTGWVPMRSDGEMADTDIGFLRD